MPAVFIPIPKKGNAKECPNCCTIALISHTSKVIYDPWTSWCSTGFRKGRGTRDQIANIRWIMEKAREFQKNIYFCFIDYAKDFVWITITVENSERNGDTRLPDLPFEKPIWGQEATVRTGHGTTDWFQIGKGVHQGCILSPCLLKCWAGWNTSWNQDCRETYQKPQICRWHHPYGRKWRGTKKPLDESKRGE